MPFTATVDARQSLRSMTSVNLAAFAYQKGVLIMNNPLSLTGARNRHQPDSNY